MGLAEQRAGRSANKKIRTGKLYAFETHFRKFRRMTMIIIIMGVAGAGKTTIGSLLARQLGWDFYDADDSHSGPNRDKMARVIPLTDEDRAIWLLALEGFDL
jgi:adenylylsulfate kinase-like enzyme